MWHGWSNREVEFSTSGGWSSLEFIQRLVDEKIEGFIQQTTLIIQQVNDDTHDGSVNVCHLCVVTFTINKNPSFGSASIHHTDPSWDRWYTSHRPLYLFLPIWDMIGSTAQIIWEHPWKSTTSTGGPFFDSEVGGNISAKTRWFLVLTITWWFIPIV